MQQSASRSGESYMTASDAESWARLRLVQGESTAQNWELVSSLGHTTLTVGSNADCTWVVRDEGVRPIHFSLHWDGSLLRVADVYSAGDVRVDGALLTSQWRPLLGRVRIDFGKAAMVVETSASVSRPAGSPEPSGDAGRVIASEPSRVGTAPRNGKETLIGVAPMSLGIPVAVPPGTPGVATPPVVATPAPAAPKTPASDPRSVSPSMKATLVGGIGAPVPSGHAKPNATLMGFSVAEALRGVGPAGTAPLAGGPSLGSEQRTVPGVAPDAKAGASAPASSAPSSRPPAGRRKTQEGVVSQPPGVYPGAVAQIPVRPISNAPRGAGNERIGSAWQEEAAPSQPAGAGRTMRGVPGAVPQSGQPGPAPASEAPPPDSRAPRGAATGTGWGGGIHERLSDIPTQMREPMAFESRRASRGFPWRYVGVLVLTAVAYFAWLYLLDHI